MAGTTTNWIAAPISSARRMTGLSTDDVRRGVGDRDDREDVVADVLRHPHAHRDEHLTRVLADDLEDRHPAVLLLHLGLRLGEHRGLLDGEAHPHADGHEHGAQQERDPPAPGEERGVGLDGREHPQHAGGEQVAHRDAGLRPGRPEAAPAVAAVLGDHQHRAAPLAADGEALEQPAEDEEQRGREADRGVRRQQADGERAEAHHQQRDDQHLLAADPVTEVAEDHAADGAGDEARARRS